jgi:hypothetical protein
MRRIAARLMFVVVLAGCSAGAPHRATPTPCHDDTPEAGVCSPLRPTV